MKRALIFLMGATVALMATSEPTQAQKTTDAALAKQIRDDASLRQVHQMALDLLKTGLNAGAGYKQVWIRDLNTFIEVSLQVNPRGMLRDALLTFFKFQGPEGDIPDGYRALNPAQTEKPYRVTPLAPGLTSYKNTVEVDQESSLVQAVYKYVAVTGDRTILDEQIDGRTVRERLGFALQYLLTERFDKQHGLIWSATRADWGDVQPETSPGVLLDANSHRALSIYDSAMLVVAINDYLELLGSDAPETARWKKTRDQLKHNIRKFLWDGKKPEIHSACVSDRLAVPRGF